MRYIVHLILFLYLVAGSLPALAADPSRYRVELIVLTHLEHDEQPRKEQRLEDYSAALDFLTPATGAAVETATEPEAADGEAAEDGAAPDAGTDSPNVVVHVPEPGAQMQDAWRRLRLSGPFRPLQQLAWEQGGDGPFPTLRVHDLEVVLTVDPLAESRALLDERRDQAVQGKGLVDGAEAPPPTRYYRLDGTASLTRSRFLHLSIAVELREPVYEADTPAVELPSGSAEAVAGTAPRGGPDPMAAPVPTSFLVHRLAQSRVVRTGRMEYFDGPVLGVLAWVTDISDTSPGDVAEDIMEDQAQ